MLTIVKEWHLIRSVYLFPAFPNQPRNLESAVSISLLGISLSHADNFLYRHSKLRERGVGMQLYAL